MFPRTIKVSLFLFGMIASALQYNTAAFVSQHNSVLFLFGKKSEDDIAVLFSRRWQSILSNANVATDWRLASFFYDWLSYFSLLPFSNFHPRTAFSFSKIETQLFYNWISCALFAVHFWCTTCSHSSKLARRTKKVRICLSISYQSPIDRFFWRFIDL